MHRWLVLVSCLLAHFSTGNRTRGDCAGAVGRKLTGQLRKSNKTTRAKSFHWTWTRTASSTRKCWTFCTTKPTWKVRFHSRSEDAPSEFVNLTKSRRIRLGRKRKRSRPGLERGLGNRNLHQENIRGAIGGPGELQKRPPHQKNPLDARGFAAAGVGLRRKPGKGLGRKAGDSGPPDHVFPATEVGQEFGAHAQATRQHFVFPDSDPGRRNSDGVLEQLARFFEAESPDLVRLVHRDCLRQLA